MRISTLTRHAGVLVVIGVFAVAALLSGCPSVSEKTGKQPTKHKETSNDKSTVERQDEITKQGESASDADESPDVDLAAELEQVGEKPRDLGPPLVDRIDQLKRLNPKQPVWIDLTNKHVVLLGEVCRAGYPLEFLATYSNRSYESVLSVNVTPSIVHAGLLAIGAESGHPARFEPEFVAPTGTEVAIELRWKDATGKIQSAPAQHWIRNIKTRKALESNWVFAGSLFITDEETGQRYYTADSGELICVLSLPTAMLDLPIRSYGAIEARMFEAFEEHLPPPGTPITILLKPILKDKPAAAPKPAAIPNSRHAEAIEKAVNAAEPWLKLVDGKEYLRSWETAAEYLKNTIDRKDFVKALSASRKPFGAVESRKLESKQFVTSVPGAPDGQYVILQYQTSFTKKKSAIETITPMLDRDKKWRVSGYYIK